MPKTIAIVEDDPAARDIFATLLRHYGYDVSEAGDGEAGLELVRETLPDAVLLDIHLPRRSGWEVARALKEDERTGSIPLIIVTAEDRDQGEAMARTLGCADYLRKPVVPQLLLKRIERCLGRRTEG